MATGSVSTGPGLKAEAETIVGTPISADEFERIPEDQRFFFRSVRPSLLQKVVGAIADAITSKSTQAPGKRYRCPKCRSTDPDVTIPVINACSRGTLGVVSVECVNKHWAYYPCP